MSHIYGFLYFLGAWIARVAREVSELGNSFPISELVAYSPIMDFRAPMAFEEPTAYVFIDQKRGS